METDEMGLEEGKKRLEVVATQTEVTGGGDGKMTEKERKRRKLISKLARQLLLNLVYFLQAICIGIRGPTLMDLQQVYDTDIKTISLSLITASVGGIMGSFLAGFLMGKFPRHKYLFTFEFTAGIAVSTMLLPRLGYLWGYFLFMVINGLHVAATHTALNVLCLDIWRGSKSGPAIHSLHSVFAIGAFVSPIVARPFLSVEIDAEGNPVEEAGAKRVGGGSRRVFLNSTVTRGELDESGVKIVDGRRYSETRIERIYMICGLVLLVVSLGFLYQAAREYLKRRRRRRENDDSPTKDAVLVEYGRREKGIILLSALCIMCFVGGEFGIFNFLPAFAVMGPLQLSKAQGVNILAVYFLAYACSRISCFFFSFCIAPRYLVAFINVFFIITGNVILLICATKDAVWLTVGYGILGFGSGSLFGNVLLWLEEHFVVSSRVTSLLAMAAGIGVNISPLIVGQSIDSYPMILIYMQMAITCVTVTIFLIVSWFGRPLVKQNLAKKRQLREEKQKRKQEGKEQQRIKDVGNGDTMEMKPNSEVAPIAGDEDLEEKVPLKKDQDA